ncbi:hypothetical protein [Lentzea albidocapillata]|uniref:Uncharacterized protein n=1 Tax=Lentzea albidocapillata TaxID=40571 RepID=A0A1W2DBK8_9PSEU|nr:hypothetical protein [Lentzea albidocapillata]SMC94793.1 hypothetical protein SAMN05660733_02824 [Lentzea albidocapillata]
MSDIGIGATVVGVDGSSAGRTALSWAEVRNILQEGAYAVWKVPWIPA